MYKTFNCGIGFIFSTNLKNALKITKNKKYEIIGEVKKGKGNIYINSSFTNKKIVF